MRAQQRRLLQLLACLLAALALGAAARAQAAPSLAELKRGGQVGEQLDGYVGIVADDLAPAARAVVERTNAERKQAYGAIAAKQGISAEQVAALAGAKLVANAPLGQFVRDSTGSWKPR